MRRHREAEELDRAALAAATGALGAAEREQLRTLLGRIRTAVADTGDGDGDGKNGGNSDDAHDTDG